MIMMNVARIKEYRDFWDFPRIFLALYKGTLLLFDCEFNDEKEDFKDTYRVFTMPHMTEEELDGSWSKLSSKALSYLGEVLISEVKFDDSRREYLDAEIVSRLLKENH